MWGNDMKYKVTKYAQSCFLIEKDGHALALDIGSYAVENNGMTVDRWPKLDGILITHKHFDHAHKPTLKALTEQQNYSLVTNSSFAQELKSYGVAAQVLSPGEERSLGAFSIRGVAQHHGDLPPDWQPGPECLGFVVDGIFYTPGDSLPLPSMPKAEVLFVPVIGPQMSFETARQMIEIVKPKLAIPMHYANTKKYPISMDEIRAFRVPGVEVLVLDDGASLTWPR